MKLLILGGTRFVGRHITETAIANGHDVTLFNRGQTHPELFPEAHKLTGNRDGELDALMGRHWDVVIDVNGYIPRIVRDSAELLQEAVDLYVFISTISVYKDFSEKGITEESPLIELEDPTVEEITGGTYGGLKVLCERAVENAMPGRVLILRPGLVVGSHDHTNRFRYWVVRGSDGGEMLAPADADLQVIDARDLARFTLQMTEDKQTDIYNITGEPHSLNEILQTVKQVSGSDTRFTWTPPEFLLENGVQPWVDLPLWSPGEEMAGAAAVSNTKAQRAGLFFSPLESTIQDCLTWEKSRPADIQCGIFHEREQALLAKWHALEQ